MINANCPGCDGNIDFAQKLRIGHRFNCPLCGEKLEVFSADPLELDVEYDVKHEANLQHGYEYELEFGDDEDGFTYNEYDDLDY